MLFNSYVFILLFLPVALAGYYLLNNRQLYRGANLFLLGMSLWFYGYFHPAYLLILCGSIAGNFALSKAMERLDQPWKKALLILGICANIGVIFYYKYYNFFLSNVNALLGMSLPLQRILLPLGISFFTFQQVSYLVDSYRGQTRGYSFDEYALFVSFFPQLIAGPIVMHNEMLPQFRSLAQRRFCPVNFAEGLFIFSLGLFKKVLIADTFGTAVAFGFGHADSLHCLEAWIISFSYTFQLFFDFSGYCDMAIGIARMFHIELPQNFNSPYKSTSIPDFWSRWHMTLTRFLRTYVYFPLGGSRKGTLRSYINIMIVFLVSGLWHGANWTFVLWGFCHGVLNCLCRIFRKPWEKLHRAIRWGTNFVTINILWVLFRADSVGQAGVFLGRMFSLDGCTIRGEIYDSFALGEMRFLEGHIPLLRQISVQNDGMYMWIFLFGALLAVLCLPNSRELRFRPTVATSLITVVLLVWSVMSLSGISTFLYFNF